ncbi:MAG: TAT-variant-translocated molybdopterin oxidoreductase [Verrucomicrobiales bacterium]|nr:TAT-variant-translocated molybdopterin oxidoreductase [Verrucomicrobiales bacterium]
MKRKFHHPEVESSHQQWRSLGELEGSEEFGQWLEREFPQGASEFQGGENSRRDFVKLMGASTALAGFGVACSRPVRHLVPFNEHVEWNIPGKALYYSTVRPRSGGLGGDPLVVTTYDGRPTKVDGNKLHPVRSGGSNQFVQASILDLYDPDRSRGYLKGGAETTSTEFVDGFLKDFTESRSGEKVAFLVGQSSSPTRNSLVERVRAAYPGAEFYQYEALAGAGKAQADEELYGAGTVVNADLTNAKRILSVDCDFLGNDSVGEDSGWQFSQGRKVDDGAEADMNRLYVVEPAFTLTGGMADHRYRLSSSQVLSFLVLLAKEIGGAVGGLGSSLNVVPTVFNSEWIAQCAADLVDLKGESVVLVGSRQSRECHLLAAAINNALGAYGSIINGVTFDLPEFKTLVELASAIEGGNVDTLFVLNEGDLLFDAPADLKFAELLKDVTVVHVGARVNLTAEAATWHVPGAHYLESWGDCYTTGGYYSVQQPMINPLWGGLSEIDFYLKLLSEGEEELKALDLVKETASSVGEKWNDILRNGFAATPAAAPAALSPALGGVAGALNSAVIGDLPHPQALDVVLTVGGNLDGRFANNSWLQEAPDPITKLTWDNAALISVGTAKKLGLEDGDLVELTKEGLEPVVVPVLRSPGHADYTLTVPVGYYGDLGQGRVAEGVGFNVYPLMTTENPYVVSGVQLGGLGRKHKLALTAEHYSMEGRAIVREGTLEMFEEHKDFAGHQGMDHHIPENVSLYKGPDYGTQGNTDTDERNKANQSWTLPGHEYQVDPNHQWAMTIDLNACTGCNSCVIACQAENNIPVVGKNQVLAGREMHWIRMDRYFTSPKDDEIISQRGFSFTYEEEPGKRKVDDDNIEMLPQPVACQQCESAPCETVCPVNATVHTGDGLNAMVYNRCIGTRYCANNCPYKARRFNYYDYNKRPIEDMTMAGITAPGLEFGPLAPATGHATTTMQLQKNPNVSVRMRGVIEKCTYCVQRITAAKVAAKVAARDTDDIQVKPNSFTVACQDACSSEAIVFGNLKAEGDRVIDSKENPRNYDLLKYIGTRPRTSYLARIKNPNMKMPGADKVGTVTSKMH